MSMHEAKSVMGCIHTFCMELAIRGHHTGDLQMWLPDKLWQMLRLEAEDYSGGVRENVVIDTGHGFLITVKRVAP